LTADSRIVWIVVKIDTNRGRTAVEKRNAIIGFSQIFKELRSLSDLEASLYDSARLLSLSCLGICCLKNAENGGAQCEEQNNKAPW